MVLRASIGTLAMLGLGGKLVPSQRTAYFMLDGRCVFDCKFCTHARSSKSHSRFLSRMVWKEVDPKEAAKKTLDNDNIKRVCFQVVSYPGYEDDLLKLLGMFRGKRISVSVRARDMEEVRSYYEGGAEIVSVSIDAASPELFKKIRGGSFDRTLELLDDMAREFPGRVATHIIIGLGETEREVAWILDWLYRRNIIVALFAFTPVKGTALENMERPSLEDYRRVQVLRFLFEKGMIRFEDLEFDERGKVKDFKVDLDSLDLKRAFLTSGCPDCTRPYYNESPGKVLYNVHDESLLDQVPDFSSS